MNIFKKIICFFKNLYYLCNVMANYDLLKNALQSNVYQNSDRAITGSVLQSVLTAFINTLGVGSNFMGILSASNKPTGVVDGKQFYVGFSANGDTVIDLSDVGLGGTFTIGQRNIYIIHNISGSWAAVDIAAGIGLNLTSISNSLNNKAEWAYTQYAAGSAMMANAVRVITPELSASRTCYILYNTEQVVAMAVDGFMLQEVTSEVELAAGTHYIDILFNRPDTPTMACEIPAGAFFGIPDVDTVILPCSMMFIGNSAFHECMVKNIVIPGANVVSLYDNDVFTNSALSDVYVPEILQNSYANNSSWVATGATINAIKF